MTHSYEKTAQPLMLPVERVAVKSHYKAGDEMLMSFLVILLRGSQTLDLYRLRSVIIHLSRWSLLHQQPGTDLLNFTKWEYNFSVCLFQPFWRLAKCEIYISENWNRCQQAARLTDAIIITVYFLKPGAFSISDN